MPRIVAVPPRRSTLPARSADACRPPASLACAAGALGTRPKFVFASSAAAYGPNERVDDDTYPQPQTSYGHQKVIGEYLTNDFSIQKSISQICFVNYKFIIF